MQSAMFGLCAIRYAYDTFHSKSKNKDIENKIKTSVVVFDTTSFDVKNKHRAPM